MFSVRKVGLYGVDPVSFFLQAFNTTTASSTKAMHDMMIRLVILIIDHIRYGEHVSVIVGDLFCQRAGCCTNGIDSDL